MSRQASEPYQPEASARAAAQPRGPSAGLPASPIAPSLTLRVGNESAPPTSSSRTFFIPPAVPRRPLAALAALALPLCGGCAALTEPVAAALPDWVPAPAAGAEADDAGPEIVQVAGFWRPGKDTGPSGGHVRGFSGKVLLLPAKQTKVIREDGEAKTGLVQDSVLARGDVRVTLFDLTGDRPRELHRYEMPADAWATHAGESNLGPGYQVFLPLLRDDGRARRYGLQVRFTPLGPGGAPGRPVFSPIEYCLLEGDGLRRQASGLPVGSPLTAAAGHAMRTETIRPVAVTAEPAAPADAGRVVPASASRPAAPRSAADGLDPAMRARMEAALAAYKRKSGAKAAAANELPPAVAADLARKRSRFADAAPADIRAALPGNPFSPPGPFAGDD